MVEQDFIYENAPLIEVIAEVRWALMPLASVPGAAVDPFFDRTSESFLTNARAKGRGAAERLTPPDAPSEFLAGQPIWRCRPAAGAWPLWQLGPGVFTCNITPPYDGWPAFRQALREGLETLFDSFPAPQMITIQSVGLRYIDGFTDKHGLANYRDFVATSLGLDVMTPDRFIEKFAVEPSQRSFVIDLMFKTARPRGASLGVRVGPGLNDSSPAAMAEFRVVVSGAEAPQGCDPILAWMEDAHQTLHDAFDAATSQNLKNAMGPKRIIQGEAS